MTAKRLKKRKIKRRRLPISTALHQARRPHTRPAAPSWRMPDPTGGEMQQLSRDADDEGQVRQLSALTRRAPSLALTAHVGYMLALRTTPLPATRLPPLPLTS